MRIDILTLFPEMCEGVLGESIIGRSRQAGLVEINCRQIRDYTLDKHKRDDDTPYGGGMGMIMQVQPIYDCYMSLCEEIGKRPHLIYMSPQGKTLTQTRVRELAQMENIAILCGHYEGIDERVIEEIVDEEISIGDYVLTGGELAAAVIADAVVRIIPGVISDEQSALSDSFQDNLLAAPVYTRPAEYNGWKVPDILLSGHEAKIKEWELQQSLERTQRLRPDLLK